MDRNTLQLLASNELDKARSSQLDIQTRLLRNRLDNINSNREYLKLNFNMDYHARNISDSVIKSMEDNRDERLSDSIVYALSLIQLEKGKNIPGVFSIGALIISSITSFIKSYNINPCISSVARYKMIETSSALIFAGLSYLNVKSNIDELDKIIRSRY